MEYPDPHIATVHVRCVAMSMTEPWTLGGLPTIKLSMETLSVPMTSSQRSSGGRIGLGCEGSLGDMSKQSTVLQSGVIKERNSIKLWLMLQASQVLMLESDWQRRFRRITGTLKQ